MEFIIGHLMGCLWVIVGYYVGRNYELRRHIRTVERNIKFIEGMNRDLNEIINSVLDD